ncbi:TonB-dependent receptor [Phenylobacterium sp.]|uniref:TonB-dependent receptor n=1 Tax=Phenylobacterium sp. TaxID=1871053 RepID=UPI002F95B2A8
MAATAAFAQAQSGTTIEELVVTAEKREQSLQDVPVAITAFTDERREVLGITSAQDLTNFTPGLAYNTGNDRLTMRGIGRLTNNRASEGGVAMYNDNFYTSSVYNANKSTIFVERTEVLRGPQGTLYGRNAIGGAINFISKRPTDEFEAEVRAGWQNYDYQQYEATVGGPLFWGMRGRFAGAWLDQAEGYYTNVGGGPSEGGRGTVWNYEFSLEGEITDKFDWYFKREQTKWDALGRGAGGRQGVTWGARNTAMVTNINAPTSVFPSTTPGSSWAQFNNTSPVASSICDRCFESDTPNQINIDSETYILHANLHLEGWDVRYVTGRTWYNYRLQTDVDGTARSTPYTLRPPCPPGTPLPGTATCTVGAPGGLAGTSTQIVPTAGTTIFPALYNIYNEEPVWFSNEINLASTGDSPRHWLLGLFQFREESNYTPTDARVRDDARFETPLLASTGGPTPANPNRTYAIADSDTRSESYAVFGQLDWDFGETFVLHAGLRYTWDEKTVVEGARLICFLGTSAACPAVFSRTTGRPLDFTSLAVGTGTLRPNGTPFDPSQIVNPFVDPGTGLRTRVLKNSWEGWGGTLGLDWKPDPDTLVYGKYSRGYKAGGFNSATTTLSPLVTTTEEKVDAFEVGAKKTFFGNFQTNVSAFWYGYTDIQAVMSAFNEFTQNNQSFYTNLPKATIKGFELETIWQPIDNLQVNFTYAYLDAKVDEGCCFLDPEDPLAIQPGAQPVPTDPGFTPTNKVQDLAGQTLGASTPHRVALNVNYTIENLFGGGLTTSASYVWRSETYYSVFNRYYNKAKAWEQIDLRAIWNNADGDITVIGFVKNLTDNLGQVGMGGGTLSNVGPNRGLITQGVSFIPPRTFGIELQKRF